MDKEIIIIGIVFAGLLFITGTGVYFLVIDMTNAHKIVEEQQRQITIVCNTDHFDLNMTQYCLDHHALNTTLWEIQHK